jgi:hypothetical protein
MLAFTPRHAAAGFSGWRPSAVLPRPNLGQVGLVEPRARENLIKLTGAVAMAGGGLFALLSIPGTKPLKKTVLGFLGGGLLVTALLNVYDAVA